MPNFIFGNLANQSKPFESTLNPPYAFYIMLQVGFLSSLTDNGYKIT